MTSALAAFPIADVAEDEYKGSGHTLAAVKDGEIVAIRYIRDLNPEFEGDGLYAGIDDSPPGGLTEASLMSDGTTR